MRCPTPSTARCFLWMAASAIASASCAGGAGADEDMKPPADFSPPPIRPLLRNPSGEGRLGFGEGFYPLEVGEGQTWRWMGNRGEVRLRNYRDTRKLRIVGWIPTEFMTEAPRIQIGLGDRSLDSFIETKRHFLWEYVVGPEFVGPGPTVMLVLETSKTVRAPGDPRDLGISIERVDWEVGRR